MFKVKVKGKRVVMIQNKVCVCVQDEVKQSVGGMLV